MITAAEKKAVIRRERGVKMSPDEANNTNSLMFRVRRDAIKAIEDLIFLDQHLTAKDHSAVFYDKPKRSWRLAPLIEQKEYKKINKRVNKKYKKVKQEMQEEAMAGLGKYLVGYSNGKLKHIFISSE
jgi:hypothetical protein